MWQLHGLINDSFSPPPFAPSIHGLTMYSDHSAIKAQHIWSMSEGAIDSRSNYEEYFGRVFIVYDYYYFELDEGDGLLGG